jgi:predicted site-specific integrase-resolvase
LGSVGVVKAPIVPNLPQELLKPAAQASRLGVHKKTLLRYYRLGLVRGIKLSARTLRFNPAHVEADLAKLSS